jgi:hypothetical protein
VRLDVGPMVFMHTLKFNNKALGANAPKWPAPPPLPGVHFDAELYPLALSSPGGAGAGLGIAVSYERALGGKVHASAEPTVDVPLKHTAFGVGVRYRMAIGSPTLTFGVGYAKRTFSADASGLMDASKASIRRDAPDIAYTIIDPGIALRLPLTRSIAFGLGGRGLIVTNAGTIQTLSSYGRAKVYGFDGVASIDVMIAPRFAVRVAGQFTQVGFSFTGAGDLSNNLDGDPTTPDVGGLADRTISGTAMLAVVY